MSHRRPPRPPTGTLTRALSRWARADARIAMDPLLADRVLAALKLDAGARRSPGVGPPTVAPTWQASAARTRGRVRTTLALLLVVGGALALAATVRAGPVEAREAWKRAQALKGGSWGARVRVLRDVRAETNRSDSMYARALRAEASVWRAAHRVHAAAATEAWAAGLGPDSDPDRAGALLTHARALRDEGDDAAARAPLLDAAQVARSAMPWKADEALDLLAEDAHDRRDEPGLRAIAERLERDDARPSSRIEAWSLLGLLALERGAPDDARRCLARAERAYRDADDADSREAARATKAWLDAALRKALPGG